MLPNGYAGENTKRSAAPLKNMPGSLQAAAPALVSADAEMKWLNGFSLAATFEGEFSGNVTSHAGKGVAKYSW
jgi:hypothetical protein